LAEKAYIAAAKNRIAAQERARCLHKSDDCILCTRMHTLPTVNVAPGRAPAEERKQNGGALLKGTAGCACGVKFVISILSQEV